MRSLVRFQMKCVICFRQEAIRRSYLSFQPNPSEGNFWVHHYKIIYIVRCQTDRGSCLNQRALGRRKANGTSIFSWPKRPCQQNWIKQPECRGEEKEILGKKIHEKFLETCFGSIKTRWRLRQSGLEKFLFNSCGAQTKAQKRAWANFMNQIQETTTGDTN